MLRPILAGLLIASSHLVAPSANAAPAASMNDCFADLERGKSTEIACEFPLKPSPSERAEMEKQTQGYLKDATCVVSIRIERALVNAAIEMPDYQFQAPPQPVSCNVTMPGKTGDQVIPITSTFAPHVTIKDSKAIEASPGLGDVKGVPKIISWPVAAYINRAGFLRTGMLKVVNAWMDHLRVGRAKAASR